MPAGVGRHRCLCASRLAWRLIRVSADPYRQMLPASSSSTIVRMACATARVAALGA